MGWCHGQQQVDRAPGEASGQLWRAESVNECVRPSLSLSLFRNPTTAPFGARHLQSWAPLTSTLPYLP